MSNLMLAIRDGAVSIPQAVWIACNFLFLKGSDQMNTVSIPQAVWIACNLDEWYPLLPTERVSIPQAVWIACNFRARLSQKQKLCFNTASGMDCMQFIFVSEGEIDHEFQYRKRYGLHAIGTVALSGTIGNCFNTASGMDCMQYCLPEALETVSPEVGFLILTPFSRFSPKCAELFCREKCFERGLKPVIARALLSTKEI